MKIAIGITMWKRPDVANLVLAHYQYLKARVADIAEIILIAVGSEGDASRDPAIEHGWVYDEFPNPSRVQLPRKFSRMSLVARDFSPDGFMGVGSDDFMDERMLRIWIRKLAEGAEYVAQIDYYEYNVRFNQAILWNGYHGKRAGESIGPFRLMSARVLDTIDWTPWVVTQLRNHDGNMKKLVRDKLPTEKVALLTMKEEGGYHCFGVQGSTNLSKWQGIRRARGVRIVPKDEALSSAGPEQLAAIDQLSA